MEIKGKFGSFLSDAGQKSKDLLDKTKSAAVHAVDQNGDGKLDISDVSILADSVGNAIKRNAQTLKENAAEKSRQQDIKNLQPIFLTDLETAEFAMPKFIRICERDKKHADSEACLGSVGYYSDSKDLRVVNVFRDTIDAFGLSYYPQNDAEFYFVDPSDRNRYIALDEYFGYLKAARIAELQKVGQDLGAKHFCIKFEEAQTTFTEKNAQAGAKGSGVGTADVNVETTERAAYACEIAAEMEFPGHEPVRPQLRYLKNDPSINALIDMRMNPDQRMQHQALKLKMSSSSGMRESEALRIDAFLNGMKVSGNTSVAAEVKNEARRYLEYVIDF